MPKRNSVWSFKLFSRRLAPGSRVSLRFAALARDPAQEVRSTLLGRHRRMRMSSVDKDQLEERLTTGILGQWYAVAKSVQVKRDKPQAVTALGRHLVLWRDTAGKLHCLEDYCPHRGARLSRGEVNADNISCRYHGVTLDGSGTIVRVPAMPGCPLEGRKAVDL